MVGGTLIAKQGRDKRGYEARTTLSVLHNSYDRDT